MRRSIPIFICLAVALALAASGRTAAADTASDSDALLALIKDRNGAIMSIVRSETGGDTEAERAQLKQIVTEMFDFRAYAEESLGRYWDDRTEEEKLEFTSLCRQLIEKNYADPTLYKKAEEIMYGSAKIEEGVETVSTKVRYRTEESAIDYKLHQIDGEWRIYDMVIDDLSVARSNRSQFRREIRKTSYEGLVKKLKEKLSESSEG